MSKKQKNYTSTLIYCSIQSFLQQDNQAKSALDQDVEAKSALQQAMCLINKHNVFMVYGGKLLIPTNLDVVWACGLVQAQA